MYSTSEKLKVLEGYKCRLWDEVYRLSGNMLMDEPKEGYEKEWAEAQKNALIITEIIKEIKAGTDEKAN